MRKLLFIGSLAVLAATMGCVGPHHYRERERTRVRYVEPRPYYHHQYWEHKGYYPDGSGYYYYRR
jgi:hypothetical protein